jgi:Transglutaminase-like superfamily
MFVTLREFNGGKPMYLLQPYVYVCFAREAAIALNLQSDEYVGFDSAQVHALAKVVPGLARLAGIQCEEFDFDDVEAVALADALVHRGVLTRDRRLGKRAAPVNVPPLEPHASRPLPTARPLSWRILRSCVTACGTAAVNLRIRGLAGCVRRIVNLKARENAARAITKSSQQDMWQLTRDFAVAKTFLYTAKDKCLFDSVALIEFLAKHEVYPTFVIGVRPNPFAAHCWVQYGVHALNGEPGLMRRYTPILAI